ncbi:MAG: exo-alpha-sialidase [Planctomycetes bacterium]|nr:exo-alpha-sialidase [Planctomycetota bacterium]
MRACVLLGGLVALLTSPASAADLGGINPDETRGKAREAFARGDYEAMAKGCEPLVAWAVGQLHAAANDPRRVGTLVESHLDDCLALGHAHQLAGEWAKAVRGYQTALHMVEAALAARQDVGRRTTERDNLMREHATLLRLIACIQRDELREPQAAAATLAKATDFCPLLKGTIEDLSDQYLKRLSAFIADRNAPRDFAFEGATLYPRQALRELAITQGQLGQHQAAIETWTRVNLARPLFQGGGVLGADVAPLGALLQKLPPGQPLPRIPMLFVLSPAAPATALKMDDPQTWLRSCGWWGSGGSDYWQFALSPSLGQEFEALEFACDLEQTDPRYGGQFKCWARTVGEEAGTVEIGSIGWFQKPPGRDVIRRAFDIPRGAGVAYFEAGIAPGKFRVHSVAVKARFRPWEELATRPEGVAPKADVWMQSECIPPNGALTRNGEPIQPGTATTGMRPGRYAFTYTVPDHPETFRAELDFAPGARYGLFINLDSPFRWSLTNLRGLTQHPPSRASLVRLPDGRWLVAYGARGSKVMLSTSADGATWEKPWPLPHCSIFDNIEPTLHLDSKGTLWLAYFSNRLTWAPLAGASYQLWLSSSRDGREWSRPRPVLITLDGIRTVFWREFGSIAGASCGAAQLVEGPGGRHWLFWREFVCSADAPEKLSELRRIQFEGARTPSIGSAHVAADPAGRLHMVFSGGREGLAYATSADGQQWSAPRPLGIEAPPQNLTGAQLLLDGTRAVLICESLSGAWLSRGSLDPTPKFEPPIKISNHVIPLCGSRACVTPDGQVALLVGGGSAWFLRADRHTLSRPVHKF